MNMRVRSGAWLGATCWFDRLGGATRARSSLAGLARQSARCDPRTVGYYLRFLSRDARPLAPDEIMAGLRNVDPAFRLDEDGSLNRGDQLLAQLEFNQAGDEQFEAEINEFREEAQQAGAAGEAVTARLASVTAILSVSVLWQGQTAEQTLDLLDPLWDWLVANRQGLIQADGEGFYEGRALILATG